MHVVLALTIALVGLTSITPTEAQVINEFVAELTGADTQEYVEVFGAPSTDYSNLNVIVIGGSAPSAGPGIGVIQTVIQVGTTDAEGLWVAYPLDHAIESGSFSLLLVDGFSGAQGQDLDTNDDGILDLTPWTSALDGVAVSNGSGQTYAEAVLARGFDEDWEYAPGGASRLPDGHDTDAVIDWVRNDFYGEGLPGYAGDWCGGQAYNTPGEANAPPLRTPLINELVLNHTGTDDHEFIEVIGDPGKAYDWVSAVVLEGDAAGNPGQVDQVFEVGVTNTDGLWSTGYLTESLENGSLTVLLAEGFSGTQGDDLDSNDDGILDLTPWDAIADSVSIDDGDIGDLFYSTVVVSPGFDGTSFTAGGLSRVPNGVDTDTVADWVRNDFDGAGFPGFPGTLATTEASNTLELANTIFPDDYYADIDTSTPKTLRSSLHELVGAHVHSPYTNPFLWSGPQTWTILELADEDPNNPANILDVYRNRSYVKFSGSYNREHTWPKSYGFPNTQSGVYPYTDCHHLFLSDGDYNTYRSNHPYATCDVGGCVELVTDFNNGQGGPGQSNWYSSGADIWETWPGRRGDVARAQLYLDVRYAGGVHPASGWTEPDLVLTDNRTLIATSGGVNADVAFMGERSVLLQWHEQDPVDDVERARNEVVYTYQGNRNPFIDHPEWAECVFRGTGCTDTLFADDFESAGTTVWSTTVGE